VAFCDLCGAEQETIKHALIDCTVAKIFWHEVKALTGAKLLKLHNQSWASDILRPDFCTDKERGFFIIGMYALWSQRNQRRHGEGVPPIRVAVNWAVNMAHDLWHITQEKKSVKPVTVRQRWQPPPSGWRKCNVDAAFDASAGQGATAAVLRSDDGSFAGGRARWYPHGLDALMMEAIACRDGIHLAREKGVDRLQVETDCQELVKLWALGNNQRSYVAPIIRDIVELSSGFLDFTLMHAPRTCNRVAHELAKQVSEEIRLGEWHITPTCIDHLVTEECNSVTT
jgi:ribonuclease HI